jgi:predicted dehydrogenase
VADAASLIKWYHENSSAGNKATWGVAENFRYLNSFQYARQQIEQLGKIIGFRVRIYANIKEGWKFLSTIFQVSSR